MTGNTELQELCEILKGLVLLLICHILAVVVIFAVFEFIISRTLGGYYSFLGDWLIISIGLWQFLYVLPLASWFSRRGETGMMNGILIGAVLTALINGGCYLMLSGL